MPEIADVIPDTTIAVEWGNDIRDRTIQRYASAAARTAAHPTPTEGDLSYLEDTNAIYVYDGAAWVAGLPANAVGSAQIVAGAVTEGKLAAGAVTATKMGGTAIRDHVDLGAVTATPGVAITGSYKNVLSETFTRPADWSSYRIAIWGAITFTINPGAGGSSTVLEASALIGGAAGASASATVLSSSQSGSGDWTVATLPVAHFLASATGAAPALVTRARIASGGVGVSITAAAATLSYIATRRG